MSKKCKCYNDDGKMYSCACPPGLKDSGKRRIGGSIYTIGTKKKKNKKKFTSEPIPDYIMRALQPKKSVHPVYGNLRY